MIAECGRAGSGLLSNIGHRAVCDDARSGSPLDSLGQFQHGRDVFDDVARRTCARASRLPMLVRRAKVILPRAPRE